MTIVATTELGHPPLNRQFIRLAAAAACTAFADWLFFGWDIGLSPALFLALLGIVAVACNGVHATRRAQIVTTFAFVAALAALIEDIDMLSVMVSTTATALFVIVMTAREASSWQQYLFEAATMPLRGPFQIVSDLLRASAQLASDRLPEWLRTRSLIAWIVPLGAFARARSSFHWPIGQARTATTSGALEIGGPAVSKMAP
jgi:hypothetical protein